MKDGTTGQILYQNTNPAQVANNAINSLTQGGSIYFTAGTYTITQTITVSKNNAQLIFQAGAKLVAANGLNAQVIQVSSDNILIQNPEIDGNSANQALGNYYVNGIQMTGTNSRVDGANIYNCRRFGLYVGGGYNNGITNSVLTGNGWNGITLGSGGGETGLYAINNEVSHSGDVGISAYAVGSLIQNNYVHDIDGSLGAVNSHWGIASEGGYGYNKITGNTIANTNYGISAAPGTGPSNTITNNTITNAAEGAIQIHTNSNTINGNTISNWNMVGIWVMNDAGSYTTTNNQIQSNQFSGTQTAIFIDSGTSNTIIAYNNFSQDISSSKIFDKGGVNTQIYGNIAYP